jgi:hypothetical protein
MLVTIVAVPNADNTGLDPDRVEKVEDLHDDVARPMLDLGTARLPSDDELAAYHQAQDAGKRDSAADGKDQAEEDRSNSGQDGADRQPKMAATPATSTANSNEAAK